MSGIPMMVRYEKYTININAGAAWRNLINPLSENAFVAFQPHYRQDGQTLPGARCVYTISDGIYGSDTQYVNLWGSLESGYYNNLGFCPKGSAVQYQNPGGDRMTVTVHVWYVFGYEQFSEND